MLVPVSWLEEYVPAGSVKDSAAELAEKMALSGSNVETVKTYGDGSVTGVVLGRLTEVRPHPDSDHLLLTLADIGAGEDIQIVTGAPNVSAGDFVPVAVDGAALPGGVRIKKTKMRGEISDGMLCSAQELGFDDKVVPLACRDGIWILPSEVRRAEWLGNDIFDVLGLVNAAVIEFEITPNRPDCLAVYGIAAEYAAVYDVRLKQVDTLDPEAADAGYPPGNRAEDHMRINIARPELCSRYIARVAEGVVIKESPWWLQKKLMLAGMRPINNIVDITNYVMLELGHPIHAFDIREVAGGEINVDTAAPGEVFTTLDGTERALWEDTLMIKDGESSIAIAGVMGGLDSEITEDTKTILIEAASFSPDSVRRTSKKLGIRTEASARFEKGVPAELSKTAVDRVCQLIMETGAGTVLSGILDCYPVSREQETIEVRPDRVNAILGIALSAHEMELILKRLGLAAVISDGGTLSVRPPVTRLDLLEEIDIVEEVARIYGYDKLESTIHADNAEAGFSKSWALRGVTRDLLTGFGLSEIQTYSFVSPSGVSRIDAEDYAGESSFVKLINPLGEENSVMRTTLLPELLEALARNYNHSAKDCRLFEIGNTFENDINEEGLPTEALSLCAGVYGEGADFFFMKGLVEEVFSKFGIGKAVLEPVSGVPTFHPGRCAAIVLGRDGAFDQPGETIGIIGEIHPDVADRYGLQERVCCFNMDFDLLVKAADTHRVYTALPRYPAVLRDISLVVADETPVGELLEIIRQRGGKILEDAALFDVYRGKQVPEGMKSLAFGLKFRNREKTLTDEEAQKALAKIINGLENVGAKLRDI